MLGSRRYCNEDQWIHVKGELEGPHARCGDLPPVRWVAHRGRGEYEKLLQTDKHEVMRWLGDPVVRGLRWVCSSLAAVSFLVGSCRR